MPADHSTSRPPILFIATRSEAVKPAPLVLALKADSSGVRLVNQAAAAAMP
jgi:hypothetical protein